MLKENLTIQPKAFLLLLTQSTFTAAIIKFPINMILEEDTLERIKMESTITLFFKRTENRTLGHK